MVSSENPTHLLLVDDEEGFRTAIAEQLTDQGFRAGEAGTGRTTPDRVAGFGLDILITDPRRPWVDGRQRLDEALTRYPDIIAIVITGFGTVREAVEITRQGAEGFITKPFQFEELRHELNTAIERRRLRAENAYLRAQLRDRYSIDGMIGRTPVMMKLFELLHTVAVTTSTVLITGDTGTGKELAARGLHDASPRRGQKFVAINCSAIPETLLEAHLFGHVRGPFTGAVSNRQGALEMAHPGPLFDPPPAASPTVRPSVPLYNKARQAWGLDGPDGVVQRLLKQYPGAGGDVNNLGSLNTALARVFPQDRIGFTLTQSDKLFSAFAYDNFSPEIKAGATIQ